MISLNNGGVKHHGHHAGVVYDTRESKFVKWAEPRTGVSILLILATNRLMTSLLLSRVPMYVLTVDTWRKEQLLKTPLWGRDETSVRERKVTADMTPIHMHPYALMANELRLIYTHAQHPIKAIKEEEEMEKFTASQLSRLRLNLNSKVKKNDDRWLYY